MSHETNAFQHLIRFVREKVHLEFYRMATGGQVVFASGRNGAKNYQNTRKPPERQLTLFNVIDIKYTA